MPKYQAQNYQPAQEIHPALPNPIVPPTATPLTEVSSLTEVDRQLVQIKKDIAEMGRAVIQNRTDMLVAVKTQIETNQAQNKVLIESTINTTMTAFFGK